MNARIALAALAALALAAPRPAAAQDSVRPAAPAVEAKQAAALRLAGRAPDVDGRLDDEAWRQARWISDFTLRVPDEGAAPPESTQVAFLVDGEALYVGARMQGRPGEEVRALVTRRDREEGSEQILVSLDTYRDRRTAYSFAVTAAGVRIDYYHPSDFESSRDYSFNPVWEARTERTADGWTAEMRIPLSQLRYSGGAEQVWGVNVVRRIPARNQVALWSLVRLSETGWSSRMGALTGLGRLPAPRRIELLPYVAAGGALAHVDDPRDPFAEPREGEWRMGGDLKVGLGSSFTLDATFNPDFGQVEADPAEVNLTQYETFFAERRPFFAEGTGLFAGRGHFYSRRIGAPPPGVPDADYFDRPGATTILGAAKVVGRTPRGLSVGVLTALTARETAETYDTLTRAFGRAEVAPLSGYAVVTAQQELGKNRSTLGFLLTAVERDIDAESPLRSVVVEHAYTGVVDGRLRWAGGKYDISAFAGFSRVAGDSLAILALQRSPRRYFQRPDASHVEVDPSRTALSGLLLGINHSKLSGNWLWDVDYTEERPGLELNDIGRLGSTDDRGLSANLRYRQTKPGRLLRQWELGVFQQSEWNFDGDRQLGFGGLFGSVTLPSFWNAAFELDYFGRAQSDGLTRGGPLMGTPAERMLYLNVSNPGGARTRLGSTVQLFRDELGGWRTWLSANASFRPGARWELSLEPRWRRGINPRQFVTAMQGGRAETFGTRYLFARVEQDELAARIRLNYALSPDLTLETYAEPFAASGRFFRPGELEAARSRHLREYGTAPGTTAVRDPETGEWTITDGPESFGLPNLDFDVVSFRSNVVLRWEWKPGSTAYAVWQQDRSDARARAVDVGPDRLWDSFTAPGDNLLILKVAYWIPLR